MVSSPEDISLSANCSARNDDLSYSMDNGTNNNSEMEPNESSCNESLGVHSQCADERTNNSLIESDVEQNQSSRDASMGAQNYQGKLLYGSSVIHNNRIRTDPFVYSA